MMKVIILAAFVAFAAAQTTRKVVVTQPDGDGRLIFNKGLTLADVESTQEFLDAAAENGQSFNDDKFSFQLSNIGYRFRAPSGERYESLVCLEQCDEPGREDCWSASDDQDCAEGLLVHALRCEDTRGKQRCMQIIDCPCVDGRFECIPSNVGVTITDSPSDNSLGYFLIDQCERDTFDFTPCDPSTQDCLSFEPCVSDNLECCLVGPASSEPATTQAATTDEPEPSTN